MPESAEKKAIYEGLFSIAENDKVRAEPFQDVEIDLGNLWLEGRRIGVNKETRKTK